jgi:hypothetical protein
MFPFSDSGVACLKTGFLRFMSVSPFSPAIDAKAAAAFRASSEAVGPIAMVKPGPFYPIRPDAGVVFVELPELRILPLVDDSSRSPCAYTSKKCEECGDYSHKINHRLP